MQQLVLSAMRIESGDGAPGVGEKELIAAAKGSDWQPISENIMASPHILLMHSHDCQLKVFTRVTLSIPHIQHTSPSFSPVSGPNSAYPNRTLTPRRYHPFSVLNSAYPSSTLTPRRYPPFPLLAPPFRYTDRPGHWTMASENFAADEELIVSRWKLLSMISSFLTLGRGWFAVCRIV